MAEESGTVRHAKVVKGSSVWLGKEGPVERVDIEKGEIVVRLTSRDDGVEGVYSVRMPLGNVEIDGIPGL